MQLLPTFRVHKGDSLIYADKLLKRATAGSSNYLGLVRIHTDTINTLSISSTFEYKPVIVFKVNLYETAESVC